MIVEGVFVELDEETEIDDEEVIVADEVIVDHSVLTSTGRTNSGRRTKAPQYLTTTTPIKKKTGRKNTVTAVKKKIRELIRRYNKDPSVASILSQLRALCK